MTDRHGTYDIPAGVDDILQHLALKARGYDNHLKWNEIAKLKSDLMMVPQRWLGISPTTILRRCVQLGRRGEDAQEIAELVERRQNGGRLVPKRSYRGFQFNQSVVPPQVDGATSVDW